MLNVTALIMIKFLESNMKEQSSLCYGSGLTYSVLLLLDRVPCKVITSGNARPEKANTNPKTSNCYVI